MDYLRAAARQHRQHTFVPTSKRVVEVSLPEAREPISLHLPGVWRIRLSGPGAAAFSPPSLGNKLLDLGLISSMTIYQSAAYYQLENPLERFIQFRNEEGYNFQHGKEYTISFQPNDPTKTGTIRIEDPRKKESRCTLSFVPPGVDREWVEKLIEEAGLNATDLSRSKYRADQWHFSSNTPTNQIPHYVYVKGKVSLNILLQVAGRLIECQQCGDTNHRTNNCPDVKEFRRIDYEKRRQRKEEREERERRNRRENGITEEEYEEDRMREAEAVKRQWEKEDREKKEKEKEEKKQKEMVEYKKKQKDDHEEMKKKEKERRQSEEKEKTKEKELENDSALEEAFRNSLLVSKDISDEKKAQKRHHEGEKTTSSPPISEAPQGKKIKEKDNEEKSVSSPRASKDGWGNYAGSTVGVGGVNEEPPPLRETTHFSPLNQRPILRTPNHRNCPRVSRVSPSAIRPPETRKMGSNLRPAKNWQVQEESSPT